MPIKKPDIPEASVAELQRAMTLEANRAGRFAIMAEGALGGAPVLRFAHETYALTLDQVMQSVAPDQAAAKSWRYVVPGAQGPSFAEVRETAGDGGTRHQYTQASEGRQSQLSAEALRWVHDEAELGDDTYEARVLRVPALHVDAVWLKNLTQLGADLYAPVRPLEGLLETERLYTPNDFFDALREAARRQPVFDNSPRL